MFFVCCRWADDFWLVSLYGAVECGCKYLDAHTRKNPRAEYEQEAEKKIRLKRLPRVLTLHLKRFKYVESLDSFSKLSHRVVFPLELRAPNMTDEAGEADADGRLYRFVF